MPRDLPDTLHQWLKTVKKAKCFREKTKIYAPTCYNQCQPAVHKLIADLNDIFKGSTIYDAQGAWVDDNGNLETEPVKVIEIAEKCSTQTQKRQFAKAIMDYATKANQHSIGIDHQEFFIARSPQIVKAYVKEMKRGGTTW